MARSPTPVATRTYRVLRKVKESEVITSFHLAAADGAPLAPFAPGQFLTFALADPETGAIVRRNYSLSGDPAAADHYRISVKRADADPARRATSMSAFLHDHLDVGAELTARGPDGRFTLDRASHRPVLLLAGGVGLTPLVPMAYALAREGQRRATFVHACESGRVQALGAELRALAAQHEHLRLHVLYRTPDPRDLRGRDHDSEGVVDKLLLQSLLPLDDYDVYLCGPTGFMQAAYALLLSLGLREERIRYEFFGPAEALTAAPAPDVAPAPPSLVAGAAPSGATRVTFARQRRTVAWDAASPTLLDFAEAQGLTPAFSCRAGVCSTCLCDLLAGEVTYIAEPLEDPGPGKVLPCCARPCGDVTLDL